MWSLYLSKSKRVSLTYGLRGAPTERELPSSKAPENSAKTAIPDQVFGSDPARSHHADVNSAILPATTDVEEDLWAKAAAELNSEQRRPGLWAKAFANENGNETAAKAAYLRERVQQLSELHQQQQQKTALEKDAAIQKSSSDAEYAKQVQTEEARILAERFRRGGALDSNQVSALSRAIAFDQKISRLTSSVNGDSLLHVCARLGLIKEARLFIKNGADGSQPNGNGKYAFELAEDNVLRDELRSASGM